MADEILSIEESTLSAIAQAIKNKGGLPQSNKLSFPNGMVSALQAIETEATVTPKITPQQKVLTPSDTSFSIDAGFHDGTGTVKIETETGSANPTSTEATYYPSAGKFFSSFFVGGTGSGFMTASGDITVNGVAFVTISNLGFTPYGCALVLKTGTNAVITNIAALWIKDYDVRKSMIELSYSTASCYNVTTTASYGQIEIGYTKYKSNFKGTYRYIVWGR